MAKKYKPYDSGMSFFSAIMAGVTLGACILIVMALMAHVSQ